MSPMKHMYSDKDLPPMYQRKKKTAAQKKKDKQAAAKHKKHLSVLLKGTGY